MNMNLAENEENRKKNKVRNLVDECEAIGYISKTVHDNKKMYTVQEFFFCELEYLTVLKYLQKGLDTFELDLLLRNPSSEAKEAACALLSDKREFFEQLVKSHQDLSIQRRNCAASRISEYSEVLESPEHHQILLMDVNSDSMSFIDKNQKGIIRALGAGEYKHKSSKNAEELSDFGIYLLTENEELYNAITKLFGDLDSICLLSLSKIMEKQCNTYEFLLENVRDARTKRSAETSTLVSKIKKCGKLETFTIVFKLIPFESSEVYKTLAILYYIIAAVNFARKIGPGALSWVHFTLHSKRCCQADLFLKKALVVVKRHKGNASSEFNVKFYIPMELCNSTEYLKLPTKVLYQLPVSDVETYYEVAASFCSQRDIAFDGIQDESDMMTVDFTESERDIMESKKSSSNTWNMLFRSLDLRVEPHGSVIQSKIDRLSLENKRFDCKNFSAKSLQTPGFRTHLEFVSRKNREVITRLLKFKLNFVHRRGAISQNLRHRYILEYIQGRLSGAMDFSSEIVLSLYPIFVIALRLVNEFKKKTTLNEIECLDLEYSKGSAAFFSWLILVFEGVFCLAFIINMGIMFVRTCIPWFSKWRYWRHRPLLPR
ncbi:hypothetical protein PUMCH_004517 [Australozyma saopauloensis]|uniref:Uncharacterized protein n=1 Tax=Australozyma saopauloensis TaxID=291208 RepID=A0AAX4HFX5_9ASCO|nr:hypothetical protein PUMCH_004517 [[Candida] saopauloensis]